MDSSPNLNTQTLELLGLTEKDGHVYLELLKLGSAPLRTLAVSAGLNRGTTYDALKRLKSVGLVGYVDAKRHRYFTAEDPQKLRGLATRKEVALQTARQKLDEMIPALRELSGSAEHRPAVRYFEGKGGVKDILEDVLSTAKKEKHRMYRVYSSAGVRDLVLAAWPTFTPARKKARVKVRTIAIGAGGKTAGLDERRWLTKDGSAPTYIFVYGGKTAYVAKSEKDIFGVVIEDAAIAATQRFIFDELWKNLG